MNKEQLHNGYCRLYAENGVRDKRTNRVYSEVVTTEDEIVNFVAE